MRKVLLCAVGALALLAPAVAQAQTNRATASVVERDSQGRATKVAADGRVYEVCRPGLTDACINPREAGLNFGNVPLDYWPGHPASEPIGHAPPVTTAPPVPAPPAALPPPVMLPTPAAPPVSVSPTTPR